MLVSRIIAYAVILFLLSFYVTSDIYNNLIFTLFIVMLYLDAKHPDIRSLIVMFAFIQLIFYELDYFVFVLTYEYYRTGLVIGDLILNAIILLNLEVMRRVIVNRPRIMNSLRSKLNLGQYVYFPTRADGIQLRFLRWVIWIVLAYSAYLFYLASHIWMIPAGDNYESAYALAKQFYKEKSQFFVQGMSVIEAIRNFLMVLVLFKTLQESEKGVAL